MGTRFNIAITATDGATARIKAIKESIGKVVRPIADVGSSVKALGKEVGVDKLARGLGSVASAANGALRGIGGLGTGLVGALGIGSLTALAAYEKQIIYGQSATLRFAQTSGVAAGKVQTLRGAAELAGLSADEMDSSLMSLGTTLQDARWGRNQGALAMMNRLGMQLKYTKDGSVDAVASLHDLAKILGPGGRLANAPVQTKRLVAQTFGAENLLSILLKGDEALTKYERDAAKLKPPISDDDLKKADQLRQKLDGMGQSFTNLGNAFTATNSGWIGSVADWIGKHNVAVADNMRKRGFWGAIGHGIAANTKDAAVGIGHLGIGAVQKVTSNVRDIGNLIAAGEGGYNSVNLGKRGNYKAARTNLVESSIGDVMRSQKEGDFRAAGKYQMMPDTLAGAVKAMHLDTSQKFDQAMQERIFKDYLLTMKRPEIGAYLNGKSDDLHAAVKGVAKEWASVKDPDTGRTHYDDGHNRATVSSDAIAEALKAARANRMTSEPIKKLWKFGDPANASDWEKTWKSPSKQKDTTMTIVLKGAPAGTQAEVTDTAGPVKTTLKVETSMPDYSL